MYCFKHLKKTFFYVRKCRISLLKIKKQRPFNIADVISCLRQCGKMTKVRPLPAECMLCCSLILMQPRSPSQEAFSPRKMTGANKQHDFNV